MLSMLTVCLWWHKKIFNSSMLSVFTLFICKYSSKDDFPNIFPLPRVYEMVSVTVLYSHVCVHQGILHSAGLRTCMPKPGPSPAGLVPVQTPLRLLLPTTGTSLKETRPQNSTVYVFLSKKQ